MGSSPPRSDGQSGGLLSLPRSYRLNLPNNLDMGARALKWGDSTSFGHVCSPLCSPDLPNLVETNATALFDRFAGELWRALSPSTSSVATRSPKAVQYRLQGSLGFTTDVGIIEPADPDSTELVLGYGATRERGLLGCGCYRIAGSTDDRAAGAIYQANRRSRHAPVCRKKWP